MVVTIISVISVAIVVVHGSGTGVVVCGMIVRFIGLLCWAVIVSIVYWLLIVPFTVHDSPVSGFSGAPFLSISWIWV